MNVVVCVKYKSIPLEFNVIWSADEIPMNGICMDSLYIFICISIEEVHWATSYAIHVNEPHVQYTFVNLIYVLSL